jgi:hypothetical protein
MSSGRFQLGPEALSIVSDRPMAASQHRRPVQRPYTPFTGVFSAFSTLVKNSVT